MHFFFFFESFRHACFATLSSVTLPCGFKATPVEVACHKFCIETAALLCTIGSFVMDIQFKKINKTAFISVLRVLQKTCSRHCDDKARPASVELQPTPEAEPPPTPVVEPPLAPVVEPLPAPVVEPLPAPVVEPLPAPVVEPLPAPVVDLPLAPVVELPPAPDVEQPPSPVAEPPKAPAAARRVKFVRSWLEEAGFRDWLLYSEDEEVMRCRLCLVTKHDGPWATCGTQNFRYCSNCICMCVREFIHDIICNVFMCCWLIQKYCFACISHVAGRTGCW